MAGEWMKPPVTLYTRAQRDAVESRRLAALKARTEDRSPSSIEEAVEDLKRLIALPERLDMIVELGWEVKDNGEVDRKVLIGGKSYGTPWNPDGKEIPSPYSARIRHCATEGLMLSKDGLFIRMMRFEPRPRLGWKRWWEPAQEDEYPYIVHRFQLFSTQLGFLIGALQETT